MINTLIYIGLNLIAAIVLLWGWTYVDKCIRLNILLWFTKWQPVATFEPSKKYAFKGVYIWQKKTLTGWKTVYVGQAVNVRNRYKQHLSNRGNPNLYKDYQQNPAKLRFKAFSLTQTHYSDLDALEKRLILKYKTHKKGYNKTAGNGPYRY